MPFSAERLKQGRARTGLSQAQLGQRLGVSPQQVAKWEQKTNVPSADTIALLAQILGLTTDWLLGLVDEPTGHLYEPDLSEDEQALIALYRRRELPDLIQRLIMELADGKVQKQAPVQGTRQADVSPEDIVPGSQVRH